MNNPTAQAPPPPPPPPPEEAKAARPGWRRVLRAVLGGLLTGLLASVVMLVVLVSGPVGPAPERAEVCRQVADDALDDPVAGVELSVVCDDIDGNLNLALGGVDGFEGVFKAPDPPSGPGTRRPDYLVWESDGCSAPVLGSGPFDFTLACTRHDFGWRNLKEFHRDSAPMWQIDNKDRVDAGFLYDMRVRCSSLPSLVRVGCDTTARVYYTAVRLNPSGVAGLPGR